MDCRLPCKSPPDHVCGQAHWGGKGGKGRQQEQTTGYIRSKAYLPLRIQLRNHSWELKHHLQEHDQASMRETNLLASHKAQQWETPMETRPLAFAAQEPYRFKAFCSARESNQAGPTGKKRAVAHRPSTDGNRGPPLRRLQSRETIGQHRHQHRRGKCDPSWEAGGGGRKKLHEGVVTEKI